MSLNLGWQALKPNQRDEQQQGKEAKGSVGHEDRVVAVVLVGWNYEGYGKPVAVYDSREKAEARAAELGDDSSYDLVEIVEMRVE